MKKTNKRLLRKLFLPLLIFTFGAISSIYSLVLAINSYDNYTEFPAGSTLELQEGIYTVFYKLEDKNQKEEEYQDYLMNFYVEIKNEQSKKNENYYNALGQLSYTNEDVSHKYISYYTVEIGSSGDYTFIAQSPDNKDVNLAILKDPLSIMTALFTFIFCTILSLFAFLLTYYLPKLLAFIVKKIRKKQ